MWLAVCDTVFRLLSGSLRNADCWFALGGIRSAYDAFLGLYHSIQFFCDFVKYTLLSAK